LSAYFKYRALAYEVEGLTDESEINKRISEEEEQIVSLLNTLNAHIDGSWARYSNVSKALFVKTMRQTLFKNCASNPDLKTEDQIVNLTAKLKPLLINEINPSLRVPNEIYSKELLKILLHYHSA
jgi:hypothetical protein